MLGEVQDLQHGRGDVRESAALAQLNLSGRQTLVRTDDQERNRVGGVRGEGGTVRLVHLVGVAVVGGQQHRAAHRERLLDDLARTLVHRFHRLDRRVKYAGVADHVAVGKVEDDHVIFAAVQPGEQLVGDQVGAHLRL